VSGNGLGAGHHTKMNDATLSRQVQGIRWPNVGANTSEEAGVVGVSGVDVDLLVLLAAGVPAGLFEILWQQAVGAFEGLLAAVAEFGLTVLQFDRIVDVLRDGAKGVAISGHAVAKPEVVNTVDDQDGDYESDQDTLHDFASLAP
jgi:hypothetical protein